jgi:hypothetical protein
MVTVRVSSEVANFYPTIGGWGGFTRIGRVIYRITQLRIHVIVTNAFLRSLARLDLAPSVVGALRPDAAALSAPPPTITRFVPSSAPGAGPTAVGGDGGGVAFGEAHTPLSRSASR